jgi:hypothetical protein
MVRDDWCHEKIQFVSGTRDQLAEPSAPLELLLSVSRDGPSTPGAQIEDRLRRAIRGGKSLAGRAVSRVTGPRLSVQPPL